MQGLIKNQENIDQNQSSHGSTETENGTKCAENADNTRTGGDFDTDLSASGEITSKNDEKSQNTEPCGQNSAFLELFSRDFADFSRDFPNISKEALYNNKYFEIFASGKENQGLTSIYKDFSTLISSIEAEALAKARHQISIEQGTVGALSGAFSPSEPYFTREQVQKMTSAEIKKHFDAIRRSQAHW